MATSPNQHDAEPSRAEINQSSGPMLLEFGATWCGHCQVAQPLIAQALIGQPPIPHIQIEDGKGRRLGRSYTVKLWPTLIFLKDGIEITRLVRPLYTAQIVNALNLIRA